MNVCSVCGLDAIDSDESPVECPMVGRVSKAAAAESACTCGAHPHADPEWFDHAKTCPWWIAQQPSDGDVDAAPNESTPVGAAVELWITDMQAGGVNADWDYLRRAVRTAAQ